MTGVLPRVSYPRQRLLECGHAHYPSSSVCTCSPAKDMASTQVSASLHLLVHDAGGLSPPRAPPISRFPTSNFVSFAASSIRGAPVVIQTSSRQARTGCKARVLVVRCEQGADQGSGVSVWLGRLAMVGFAAALSVEIGTGKGLLENFGLTTPLPTVALAATGLVGVLTAIFIFQSASRT